MTSIRTRFFLMLCKFTLVFAFFVPEVKGEEIMPLSQVKAGDKGYGLAVFSGTKPEKFSFKVNGILSSTEPIGWGKREVLVELSGGPTYENGKEILAETKVFAGMSGSPLFIDGKIFAAVTATRKFVKGTWAYAVPVESMFGLKLNSLDLPNQLLETVDISGGDKRSPDSGLEPGAAYSVCEVWGDEYNCDMATVTARDPQSPDTFYLMGHAGSKITGIAGLPFWRAEIFGIDPGFESSGAEGQKIGPMLGSVIFDGPFGQIGKLGVFPKSIPLTVSLANNFKNGDWHNRYFLAYSQNTGGNMAKIVDGKLKLTDDLVTDVDTNIKIETEDLGTVTISGKFESSKLIGQLVGAFLGRRFNPRIKSVNLDLTARPKYEVFKLASADGEFIKNSFSARLNLVISASVGQDLTNSLTVPIDKKYLGKQLSVSSGREVIFQIIGNGAEMNKEMVESLKKVSDVNALYLFYTAEKIDNPAFEGVVILDSNNLSSSGRSNRLFVSKSNNQKGPSGWKKQERERKIEILAKINLPSRDYFIEGRKDFVVGAGTDAKGKKKK